MSKTKTKELRLSDFSEETQNFLRQFGIDETVDIRADFDKILNPKL